jgi:hypothetical protein
MQASSPRVVLIQEGTNASCGPCAQQNPIFQPLMKSFTQDKAIPVCYHASWPGNTDVMYQNDKAMNDGIISTYYGFTGVPTAVSNGKLTVPTPSLGWYAGAPGDTTAFHKSIDSFNVASPTSPITITISHTNDGTTYTAAVTVTSDVAITGKKLKIVVVEPYHYYSNSGGTNGEKEFFWVARKMLPSYTGVDLTLNANEPQTFTQTYTPKSEWTPGMLYIVAYVQDDATHEVLQAKSSFDASKVKTITAEFIQNPNVFSKINRNATITQTVTLKNPGTIDGTFGLSVDASTSFVPSGWNASVVPTSQSIAAGQTADFTITMSSGANANFMSLNFLAQAVSESAITPPAFSHLYALTSDTKYAIYTAGGNGAGLAYNALTNLGDLQKDAAVLFSAVNEGDILAAYKPEDYNLAMFDFDVNSMGLLGGSTNLTQFNQSIWNHIGNVISAGKPLVISSQVDLTYANLYSTDGVSFYNNTLKLDPQQNAIFRLNQQQTAVVSFNTTGISGDPIGDQLNFSCNNYSQTNPYYVVYTDVIIPVAGSNWVPFMYYDNSTTHTGGVHNILGNSKVVYMSMGFDGLSNSADRELLMKRILLWNGLLAPSGVDDNTELSVNTVSVAPNPVTDNASITLTTGIDTRVQINVVDLTGQVVANVADKFVSRTENFQFNTSGFASGTYRIVASCNGHTVSTPLVIVK